MSEFTKEEIKKAVSIFVERDQSDPDRESRLDEFNHLQIMCNGNAGSWIAGRKQELSLLRRTKNKGLH